MKKFNSLDAILDLTKKSTHIKVRQLVSKLKGKGAAFLMIIFSLPFCIPIPLPGLSTVLGIFIAFLGIRIAFGQKLWWPKWILNKEISSRTISRIVIKTMKVMKKFHHLFCARLIILAKNPFFHCFNGVLVFLFALLLAIPLPIPLMNLFSALPILFIGLGLLYDDGVCILISYMLVFVAALFFFGLVKLEQKELGYVVWRLTSA